MYNKTKLDQGDSHDHSGLSYWYNGYMNNQELVAVIYRAITNLTEEDRGEDKVPSQVEMAERIAIDVLLYLQNSLNVR